MKIKRIFVSIVILFAFIGGINAIATNINKQRATIDQQAINKEAEGFASAFMHTYLTLPAEKTTIKPFTDLQDDRPGTSPSVAQEVEGVWVQGSRVDANTKSTIVDLLVDTKAIVEASTDKHGEDKVVHRYWEVTVQVDRDEKGKLVITRYPSIQPLTKGKASAQRLDNQDDTVAKAMTPMLESFFKTYLSAEKAEDIANFFSIKAEHTLQPLGGKLVFDSMQKVEAYGKGPWLVFVTLKVKDPITDILFSESYTLKIEKNSEKYFIQSVEQ